MLKLNEIMFFGAHHTPEPQRELEMDAEFKQLWPKIMALNAGDLLRVPYDTTDKMWAGYRYERRLRKLFASQQLKFCNLKVWRKKGVLYITAVRDIWQPIEDFWAINCFWFILICLFYSVRWTTGTRIAGLLLAVWLYFIAMKCMKLLKDHIKMIEERLEALEARTK